MSSQSIILPSKPRIVKEDETKGVYEIDGLYPGFGHTLGNSLRRIILSSISGAAITSLSIDGVKHEFSTLDGIKENVIEIILNLKKVNWKLHGDEPMKASLRIKGLGSVIASSIDCPSQLEIMNKDQFICEVTSKDVDVMIEMTIERGLGYVPREEISKSVAEIGQIVLDASFTPIRRASYEVDNMRVGDRTDHNRLRIAIETDGTVTPHDALEKSIAIMINQLQAIVGFKTDIIEEPIIEAKKDEDTQIETLSLGTRTENALIASGIGSVGALTALTEEQVLGLDGLGEKGLNEIKSALSERGLSLK